MRKSIVFIVVFLLITLISKAQSESYYIYDKVRILTENASIYHLQLQPGLSERQQYIIDSLVRVNSSQVIVTGNNHYIIQVDDHNAQRIKREILSCSNSILYFSKEYLFAPHEEPVEGRKYKVGGQFNSSTIQQP
jgi:hypothetical protein